MNQANMQTSTSAHNRSVVAFFESREAAQRTVEKLVRAGVSRTDVNMVEGGGSTTTTSRSSADADMGFWESLKDLFLPEEDRHTYAEGLRRGGYLVSVRTTDAQYDRIVDILDDEGAIDMDERESSWRREGWTGYQAGSQATAGSSATGARATGTATGLTGAATGASGTAGATSANRTATAGGREESIPIVEEQLRVGKRAVEQGRVRIRSYVVETPVQEQVNLRQEHVTVERRPVDRAVTGNEANLFKDRTIEAEERSEQAVVAKEARVKEEIAVRKNVEERTETVSDKVRRTEVEVTDERGDKVQHGTQTGTGTRTTR